MIQLLAPLLMIDRSGYDFAKKAQGSIPATVRNEKYAVMLGGIRASSGWPEFLTQSRVARNVSVDTRYLAFPSPRDSSYNAYNGIQTELPLDNWKMVARESPSVRKYHQTIVLFVRSRRERTL